MSNIKSLFSEEHPGGVLMHHPKKTGPKRFNKLEDAMMAAMEDEEASGVTYTSHDRKYTVRKHSILNLIDVRYRPYQSSWIKMEVVKKQQEFSQKLHNLIEKYRDKEYDIIVSINVHEEFEVVKEQLLNLKHFFQNCKSCIIYNCNYYMLDIMQDFSDNDLDIIINPEPVNKLRHTGKILKGILSNLKIIHKYNIKFKYFISLSSRSFLFRQIYLNNIEKDFLNIKKSINPNKFILRGYHCHNEISSWQWPKIKDTLLFKHLKDNNMGCYGGGHEGCCIDYNTSNFILKFLSENIDIENNCYSVNICMEEFVIHSLSYNFGNTGYIIIPSKKTERNINSYKNANKLYGVLS